MAIVCEAHISRKASQGGGDLWITCLMTQHTTPGGHSPSHSVESVPDGGHAHPGAACGHGRHHMPAVGARVVRLAIPVDGEQTAPPWPEGTHAGHYNRLPPPGQEEHMQVVTTDCHPLARRNTCRSLQQTAPPWPGGTHAGCYKHMTRSLESAFLCRWRIYQFIQFISTCSLEEVTKVLETLR